jgi:hypothetical protein
VFRKRKQGVMSS